MELNKKPKENKLTHPCFPQPPDSDTKVWRYMDLGKLIYTISKECLFLCRTDLLGDPHEGSISKLSHDGRRTELEKHGIKDKAIEMIENLNQTSRKWLFANCWRLDDHESEAMWRLYCPDNKGIAIQTTYKKLFKSIDYDDSLYIGCVSYIDYEKEWMPLGNLFYPIMHKRKAFEHEKEVRLVKTEPKFWGEGSEKPPNGIICNWNIDGVIENIYVNPYAESWYYETIVEVLKKYEKQHHPVWSALKATPYY